MLNIGNPITQLEGLYHLTKTIDELAAQLLALNTPEIHELLDKLKRVEPLQNILDTVSEPERGQILHKVITFADRDSRTLVFDKKETTHFSPAYTRFDFVNCFFTGVGFEWDAKHIALIWDIYPHLDSVMVIPTTSKYRKESKSVFSVGDIKGLYGSSNTTLLISDMTRVSRKRIESLEPYNHPKKGEIKVRLPISYGNRILDGIVSTYASISTFEETLMEKTGTAMVSNLRVLKDHRFFAIISSFDSMSNILHFTRWNENHNQQLQLIQPSKQISKDMKKQLIKDLFAEDTIVRTAAEDRYKQWYM